MQLTTKYTTKMKYTTKSKEFNADDVIRWLRLLPLVFVLVGGLLLFFGVRQLMRANASQAWPAVTGVVTVAELGKHMCHDRDDTTTYSADISYDYVVNDRTYVNGVVNFGAVQTSDPSTARRVLKRYPVGLQVPVYYNPADPQEAVLEPGLQGGSWFLPIFGTIFLIVGVGVFFLLLCMGRSMAEPV